MRADEEVESGGEDFDGVNVESSPNGLYAKVRTVLFAICIRFGVVRTVALPRYGTHSTHG